MFDFWTLSLPETSGIWLGLATQALIRTSTLAQWGPRVIVLAWLTYFWSQAHKGPDGYGRFLRYGGTVLVVLVLFWPEVLIFGGGTTSDATQVASYAASRDPGAEVITAADTGMVQPALQGPMLVPWGLKFVLGGWQGLWLSLGKAINNQTHRTFSNLVPMQWLLGSEMTAEAITATGDWVHNCYVPILTQTMEGAEARTSEDLNPWTAGTIREGLTTRAVIPRPQPGQSFIGPPDAGASIRCDVYLANIEFLVQNRLGEATTPNGTPLNEVFQQELHLDTIAQARFILTQEIRRAVGPAIPPTSLLGQYLALRGIKLGLDAGLGALTGAGAGGWGALVGGLIGAVRGGAGEVQELITNVSWMVRIALLATWLGPYALGQIQFVCLSCGPLLLLVGLMGRHMAVVLGSYIMLLGFITSSPLWYAFVDQFSKVAASRLPQIGTGYDGAVVSALGQQLWMATITAIGLLVVPICLSALLLGVAGYGAFRMVSSLWRGGF